MREFLPASGQIKATTDMFSRIVADVYALRSIDITTAASGGTGTELPLQHFRQPLPVGSAYADTDMPAPSGMVVMGIC